MLFNRFKKTLMILMACTMMESTTFAADTQDGPTAVFTIPSVSNVEKENEQEAENGLTMSKEAIADYDLEWANRAEDVLENGIRLNQSVTKNNIIFTLESIYSDNYTYRFVCSIEKVDQTAFSDEEINLREFILETKEEIERRHKVSTEHAQQEMTYEEMIKMEAEKDENLRQFIHEDGTIDEEGIAAYYDTLYADANNEPVEEENSSYVTTLGRCKVKDSSDKKLYFLLEGSYSDVLEKDLQLQVGQVEAAIQETYKVNFDLATYLKENANKKLEVKENERIEEELGWLNEEMDEGDEFYQIRKKSIEKMPSQVLQQANLDLPICEEDSIPTINNVGFIDQKLHILLTKEEEEEEFSHFDFNIYDEKGEPVKVLWAEASTHYDLEKSVHESYYVYDIPDAEALSQYSMQIFSFKTKVLAEGPWVLDVKMQPTTNQLTQIGSQVITYNTGKQATLKEMELTPLSFHIQLENENKEKSDDYLGQITLNMKKGKTIILEYSDAKWKKGSEVHFIYIMPGELITLSDVESITIGDQTITLE